MNKIVKMLRINESIEDLPTAWLLLAFFCLFFGIINTLFANITISLLIREDAFGFFLARLYNLAAIVVGILMLINIALVKQNQISQDISMAQTKQRRKDAQQSNIDH